MQTIKLSFRGLAGAFVAFALCAGAAFAAPKITSPEPIFEFGARPNTETVPHDFVIRNEGTSPLEIADVKSSCGCTVAKLDKKTLMPGEETAISATLKLSGEGPRSQNVTVLSNDPDNPSFVLGFRGEAVAAVKYEPQTLDFGQITDDESHELTLKMYSALDDLTFNITDVSLNHDFLEARFETVEEGKSYEITVRNTEPFPDGRLSGMLVVHTDNPNAKQFRIFVAGQKMGDYLVQPEMLRVRYEDVPDKTINSFLRVSPGRIKEFNLVDAVTPLDSISVEFEKQGTAFLVRLQNLPVDGTLENKELILKTDVEGHEDIVVPITVMRPQPAVQRPAVDVNAAPQTAN